MKKQLILLILILYVGLGCSKDTEGEFGSITATVAGEVYSSKFATGIFLNEEMLVSVLGSEKYLDTTSPILHLSIIASSTENIVPGSYLFDDGNCIIFNDTQCGFFSILYEGDVGGSANTLDSDEGGYLNLNIESVEFKEGGHIKGSFSGVVIDEDTFEELPLTNGRFDIKII